MKLKDLFLQGAMLAQHWADLTGGKQPLGVSSIDAAVLYKSLMDSTPELALLVTSMSLNEPAFESTESIGVVHFLARWASFGFPTFRPTSDLSLSLMATDCTGLADEIQLPFDSFLIVMPEPLSLVVDDDRDHSQPPVQFILVHRLNHLQQDNYKTPEEMLAALEAEKVTHNLWIWLMPTGNTGLLVHDHRPWPLTIDAIERPVLSYAPHALTETDCRSMLSAERLIANLSLYLDNVPEDTHHESCKVHVSSRAKDMEPIATRQWQLGKAITLGVETRAAIRAMLRGAGHASPAVRFMVRGHWRNQACGPAHKERKRIRIAPFWKGPQDEAAVLTRLYAVGKETDDVQP